MHLRRSTSFYLIVRILISFFDRIVGIYILLLFDMAFSQMHVNLLYILRTQILSINIFLLLIDLRIINKLALRIIIIVIIIQTILIVIFIIHIILLICFEPFFFLFFHLLLFLYLLFYLLIHCTQIITVPVYELINELLNNRNQNHRPVFEHFLPIQSAQQSLASSTSIFRILFFNRAILNHLFYSGLSLDPLFTRSVISLLLYRRLYKQFVLYFEFMLELSKSLFIF